jgi:hypothetical protein
MPELPIARMRIIFIHTYHAGSNLVRNGSIRGIVL